MSTHNTRTFLLAILIASILMPAATAQVSVSLPALSVSNGGAVTIPVNVGDLTGQNVLSYEFIVTGDSTLVRWTGIDVSGTLSNGLSVIGNYYAGGFTAGRMKVVCATAMPITGSGVLVKLKGMAQSRGGRDSVQLSGFIFNTGSPAPLITNGSVTVMGPVPPPHISAVSAKSVAEGNSLLFSIAAVDSGGYAMTFSSSNLPRGASLGATSGSFSWAPDFTQSGTYSINVKVTDTAGGKDSTVIPITVTNVNRKPSFTPIAPLVLKDIDSVNVTVTATDPDADLLLYTYVSISPQATTSPRLVGNLLKWKPAFVDAGSTYIIKIRVSDTVTTGGGPVPGVDTLSVSVTINRRARGDVDGNGIWQASDASLVLKAAAGLISLDAGGFWAADLNGDGEISAADAVSILRAAAGIITITGNVAQSIK